MDQPGGPSILVMAKAPVLGADVVFGPARDGGYYLVALEHAAPVRDVFDLPASEWGGPQVLASSLARTQTAGLRTGLIGVEYDLDIPDDATAALADSRVPPEIMRLLRARDEAR